MLSERTTKDTKSTKIWTRTSTGSFVLFVSFVVLSSRRRFFCVGRSFRASEIVRRVPDAALHRSLLPLGAEHHAVDSRADAEQSDVFPWGDELAFRGQR